MLKNIFIKQKYFYGVPLRIAMAKKTATLSGGCFFGHSSALVGAPLQFGLAGN
jgi:hypothetical protein